MPRIQIKQAALAQVLLECEAQLRGQSLAGDEEIDFIVQAERTMIDVRRSQERPPSIHHQYLRVHHSRAVLKNLDPRLEQYAVSTAPCASHDSVIAVWAAREHTHAYAPGARGKQFLSDTEIRNKVRRAEIDTLSSSREEELDEHTGTC